MMTGPPRSSRTVVAVSGDCSLLPPCILPAWVAIHSATRSYARSRSAGPMASRSLANCSVSTNSSTYFMVTPFHAGLAVQLGHPPHHLLRRHVLHVRRDGPPVPERVHDVAVPVAVELVLRGTLQRRAKLHCSCDNGIHVVDVDEHRSRGAVQATGRRGLGPPLRVLILDDDDRIADLDLGMGDSPVRAREAHPLGCAKHRMVELQGLPAPLNCETWRDTAVRVRDRVGPWCRCHPIFLLSDIRVMPPRLRA